MEKEKPSLTPFSFFWMNLDDYFSSDLSKEDENPRFSLVG